jgi:hypothetical protein
VNIAGVEGRSLSRSLTHLGELASQLLSPRQRSSSSQALLAVRDRRGEPKKNRNEKSDADTEKRDN